MLEGEERGELQQHWPSSSESSGCCGAFVNSASSSAASIKVGFPQSRSHLESTFISSKTSSRAPPQRTLAPPDQRTKSRSLPRGLPSDGVFDRFGEEDEARQEALQEEARREALLQEEMRLKFEFEELLNLKSELERRKKTERREINELQVIINNWTCLQLRQYDSSGGNSNYADPISVSDL